MCFRDEAGKWRNRSTGYRKNNHGERRQAEILCDRQTHNERVQRPAVRASDWAWVDEWIDSRWGNRENGTYKAYLGRWRRLQQWLSASDIKSPVSLTREACLRYPQWRLEHGGARNTAIEEMKLLGRIMKEAVARKMVNENPARALGLEREHPEEGRAWTDQELVTVDTELAKRDRFGWMRCTYLLGRYQAARIASCAVPLKYIDLDAKTITFPNPKGGRARAYTQPIDGPLLEPLREIVEHRKAHRKATLCDIPFIARKGDSKLTTKKRGEKPPSVQWREFLDSLGITDVSHHDLRRTWVTKAALAGIPESIACRFSNHSSLTVHRIYQKFTTGDMAAMLARLH